MKQETSATLRFSILWMTPEQVNLHLQKKTTNLNESRKLAQACSINCFLVIFLMSERKILIEILQEAHVPASCEGLPNSLQILTAELSKDIKNVIFVSEQLNLELVVLLRSYFSVNSKPKILFGGCGQAVIGQMNGRSCAESLHVNMLLRTEINILDYSMEEDYRREHHKFYKRTDRAV